MACQTTPEEIKKVNQTSTAISDSSVISLPVGYQFPSDSTFTVLSWNVEHFVDPFDDPYINHLREDSPSYKLPGKVALLVKAIRKAEADIVVLQEFESEKYLMKLAQDSFPEMNYYFFSDAASPNWYMNVVLMSRFPLGVLHAYGDATTPLPDYRDEEGKKESQSKINTRMWSLQIFAAEGYQFWLTGVHLKAGRGERNEAMRLGQIHLLQSEYKKLRQLNPNANLLMVGDFNAYPNGKELKTLKNTDNGSPYLIDRLDSGVYTHPADSPHRRLDYILMNQDMEAELIEGSLEVKHFFSSDSMRMLSDHLPLMVKFRKGNF